MPSQIHREILIREAGTKAAAILPLAVSEKRWIQRHFLLRNTDQHSHATEIVATDTAGTRAARKLGKRYQRLLKEPE